MIKYRILPKNTKYYLPCTPQNPARAGAGGSDKASLHHGDILPGLHHEHRRLAAGQGSYSPHHHQHVLRSSHFSHIDNAFNIGHEILILHEK